MSQAGSATGGSGGGGSGILVLNYVAVNTATYTVQNHDEFIGVNTSSQEVTIYLPDAPHVGRVYIIKDRTGDANDNDLTVTTVGGTVNIDGDTEFIMNSSSESIQVLFTGTEYLIF